uniref:Reverse transcriptase domain-containing protein n=1 Tax=Tanacetum cinerariifolium TaxID=118510 RepID=A0A6L2MGR4_TANCI|nr:hypothetical protein [Tanacetum cinerariifolium]
MIALCGYQSEEEVTEAIGEPTVEEYMMKTREDYGSGIARPNESDNKDAKEHIENVLEIVDLFYIPDVTKNQIMLQVFPMSLIRAVNRWLRNEPAGLVELTPTRLIIELADRTIKRRKRIAENVLVDIDKFIFPVDFVILDMLEDIKVPLILGRAFLSTAHTKIDVFKRKITLKVGNEKIMFKSDKPTSNIIKRVYALVLREQMELDLEARLMGEALILNRSLDPIYGDLIDEPMEDIGETRNDNDEISNGIDEYPSFCDIDTMIHIDCAYNLQFLCMIDKVDYEGKNVVGAFINVPIFVGNFSVVTYLAVVENMDAYRDEGMGDIIVGKLFCRKICVKSKRFDGMITIYNVASLFFWQWQLSSLAVGSSSGSGNSVTGSGNALCILFPTILP